MKLLYVLPVKGGGGGAHSVAQEVNELIEMGIDARIAVNLSNLPSFITNYSDMPNIVKCLVAFENEDDLSKLMSSQDYVVCTIFTSVRIVKNALDKLPKESRPKVAYYVQDYEPLFVSPDTELWQEAFDSYTLIDNNILFAKTDWIRSIIKQNHNVDVIKVSPSIDHSVYKPGLSKPQKQIWISAMIRPASPRRAPYRTMKVLKNIDELFGDKVNINIFGCSDEDVIENNLPVDFSYHNHGALLRGQVASLLATSHLFIDLSDYQAFGRTGLEAMACGCVSIVPSLGGTDEYAVDGENSYAVDPRDEKNVIDKISEFIALTQDEKLKMQFTCIDTAQKFSVRKAAISEYMAFSLGG